MGIMLFTVSNASFSHRRVCFYTNSFLCQGSPSLSRTIYIITAMRQGPSLLCRAYPRWIITRAISPHQTVCTYPRLQVSFSYQSLFSFRLNPSPAFLWLLPYANVEGSYKKQWDGKGCGQKHSLTRAVLPADSQSRTRERFSSLVPFSIKSTVQISHDKGDPEMEKDSNDQLSLGSWLCFACSAHLVWNNVASFPW